MPLSRKLTAEFVGTIPDSQVSCVGSNGGRRGAAATKPRLERHVVEAHHVAGDGRLRNGGRLAL
jgi:hypothetical protein